jgi:MFS family permease
LIEPKVMIPSIVMVLCAYAYGAVYTVLPDFGEFVGIRNKGLLFTCLTVASFIVRLIAGKASDVYGRKPVLVISTMVMFLSMAVVAFSHTALPLIIGVTIYGLAQGSASPTLLAWATDLSDIKHKGRGVATLYMAMELGIMQGAFISGLVYANDSSNFFLTFIISGVLALVAFFYLLTVKTKRVSLS